jgi:flagellar basal-body rod protein FlgC
MVRSIFSALDVSSSGITVQRTKMNLIAENIANAQTTHTASGEAYRRRLAVVETGVPGEDFSGALYKAKIHMALSSSEHMPEEPFKRKSPCSEAGVHVAKVTEDPSPQPKVYDPNHPDADTDGYVTMPNVNIVQEMTDLINTSRAFEANVTAINSTKDMLRKAIKI